MVLGLLKNKFRLKMKEHECTDCRKVAYIFSLANVDICCFSGFQ